MRVQHLNTTKYISFVSCVSSLFTSWHCLLKLMVYVCGYLPGTNSHPENSLNYGLWSQAFFYVDYLSTLFSSTITGDSVWSFRSFSLAVALIISDSHKLIALPYSEQSPLAAESYATLTISLRLASSASFSSLFSSPCYVDSHCSAFPSYWS